mgnify:CR=1 FL=1
MFCGASATISNAGEHGRKLFEQPVEVDAREEGAEFVEGMTPEELERLLAAST